MIVDLTKKLYFIQCFFLILNNGNILEYSKMTEPCSSIETHWNHENPYIYCHAALKKKRMNNVNKQDN
jgi:hypothetical protein